MDDDQILTCAQCGEPIGVFEPLYADQPDGQVTRSSYLNLGSELRRRRLRVWHLQCVAWGEAESS